ncbi:MAG TPA: hypothetical protein VIL83_08565 [Capillibacterium sp.]
MDLWVCIFCGKKVQLDPPDCYLYDEGVVCVECHRQRVKQDEVETLPR